jgi:hypothetical protein
LTGIVINKARSKTQVWGLLQRILVQHPSFWALAGGILFAAWGGAIPRIRWNVVEMMIGRNLLLGKGFVMAPLDPPALGRPLLGPLLCAVVELFNTDPYVIFRVIYATALTVFLITMFYAAKALWDTAAAHLACVFVVTSGALTGALICHVHGFSHIVFLLVVGPALWCTVLALQNPTRIRLFSAGAWWGLVYCARWEVLLFFAVTAGILLKVVYAENRRLRTLARVSAFVGGFALFFVPSNIYQSWVKAHYGIWGPSAITTFYNAEAWVNGDGDEEAGFAKDEQLYGSLESNRFSLLRAMARNPAALRARLAVNVPRFFRFFAFEPFFQPVFLVLLLGFGLDLALARKRLTPLVWLGLLFLCTTTVCFFQIDSRYLTICMPVILLILCGGLTCLGNGVQRMFGRGKWAASLACLALLGLLSGATCYYQLIAVKNHPARGEGVRALEFTRGLAQHFRQATGSDRPAVLMVRPDPSLMLSEPDLFMVSYFAGTAIAWPESVRYRRDKVFSMIPKQPEYVYLPQGASVGSEPPIAEYHSHFGVYSLFRASQRPASDGQVQPSAWP